MSDPVEKFVRRLWDKRRRVEFLQKMLEPKEFFLASSREDFEDGVSIQIPFPDAQKYLRLELEAEQSKLQQMEKRYEQLVRICHE